MKFESSKENVIYFVDEDILGDHGFCAILNPCNLKGVAGKGLSKDIKTKYPGSFIEYKRFCKDGSLRIGSLSVSYVNTIDNDALSRMIIHFPTKDHWKDGSKIEYIKSGLLYLKKNFKNTTIAIPALGCGLGGLLFKDVNKLILDTIKEMNGVYGIFCTSEQYNQIEVNISAKEN